MSCECNGMSFIGNRWVFTNECEHSRAKEVEKRTALVMKAYRSHIGKRYGWSGHNFPSEGYKAYSGASVTWFRHIGTKKFKFTVWLDELHRSTSMQVMDVTGDDKRKWHTRHMFVN